MDTVLTHFCYFVGMSDDESDSAVTDRGSTPPLQADSLTESPSESCSSTAPSTDSKPVITKIKVPSRKALTKSSSTKRTKLERSLEFLYDTIVASAASEMDRYWIFEIHMFKQAQCF